MIELLLAKSADVDALNRRWETPLHVALTRAATLPIVAILINAKANMEARDSHGMTALNIAIISDLPEVALLLLEHGANVEGSGSLVETPLNFAVRNQQERVVKFLLENGASLARRHLQRKTALHLAVRAANVDIMVMLLKAGADIHAVDHWGYTALHQAVEMGQESQEPIVRQLLSHSASLDAVSHDGDTVFHLAVIHRRQNLIPILLIYVEPGKLATICRVRNRQGNTPLDLARELAENKVGSSNESWALYMLEKALELSYSESIFLEGGDRVNPV